jgi:hypothetical protein
MTPQNCSWQVGRASRSKAVGRREPQGPTNHDDFIESIYFFDPSGHRLELTVRTERDQKRIKQFEEEAPKVLDLWDQTHDWSQREKMFGGKTGYSRGA